MIKKISINNFKLYKEDVNVPLNNMNLFTGVNGRGKSTVLQVFLLLSQSAQINRATNKIFLNGDNVNLGSFDDVKNKESLFSEQIRFGFDYEGFSVNYFTYNNKVDASEVFIDKIEIHSPSFKYEFKRNEDWYFTDKSPKSKYILFDLFLNESTLNSGMKELNSLVKDINLTNIHYVSADRIGPKIYYQNKSLSHFVSVGSLGENTVNVLYQKGNDLINEKILSAYAQMFNEDLNDLSRTVEDNVNYWIDKVFQGAKVRVEPIKGEDLLKLRINSDGKSGYFKPTNVGYGFSYSLPIIVAGLIAKPNEILIIENPEAHLHPCAQSIISKFLSIIASTGVQVVVESHSEHILNGIRVSIKDNFISQDNVNVLYFDKQSHSNNLFKEIKVDSDGGIDVWPRNFFDQATNDLNYLLGI